MPHSEPAVRMFQPLPRGSERSCVRACQGQDAAFRSFIPLSQLIRRGCAGAPAWAPRLPPPAGSPRTGGRRRAPPGPEALRRRAQPSPDQILAQQLKGIVGEGLKIILHGFPHHSALSMLLHDAGSGRESQKKGIPPDLDYPVECPGPQARGSAWAVSVHGSPARSADGQTAPAVPVALSSAASRVSWSKGLYKKPFAPTCDASSIVSS